MKRALLIAAVIGLAACSSSDSGDAGGTTTTSTPAPRVLGKPVTVGTARFTPYNLSVDSGGKVVTVAWNDYDEDASKEAPFLATSTDGGKHFAKPVALDEAEPYAAYPQVAVADDGTILVGVTLYEDGEEDGRAALYRSTDRGRSFERAADLADAPRVSFTDVGTTIAVSDDGDDVVMAWTQPGTAEVTGVVSTDGGSTFGDPVTLTVHGGASRARAFSGDAGAGVVVVDAVPLPDPPAPTPANPNPVTSTPTATWFPVDGTTFGKGTVLAADDAESVDQGPGAASGADRAVAAWWEGGADGATLMTADLGPSVGRARQVLPDPARPVMPVEVAVDAHDTAWYLTLDPPEDPENPPAPIVLASMGARGSAKVMSAFSPKVTRSAEEYDLAPAPNGIVVVWFADKTIRSQLIGS